MQITELVSELLFEHNCVIIPGFGGFVANFKSSTFEEERLLASPSLKKVAFNQSLIENDGLLVQKIAATKGITYDDAMREVRSFVKFIGDRLRTYKNFEFKNVGSFYLNKEETLVFVPYEGLNFYPKSFGLSDVKVKRLERSIDASKLRDYRLDKDAPIVDPDQKRKVLFPWKAVAAAFVVLCAFTFVIWQLMGGPIGKGSIAEVPPMENSENAASILGDSEHHIEPTNSDIIIEDVTDDVLPSNTNEYPINIEPEPIVEEETSNSDHTTNEVVNDAWVGEQESNNESKSLEELNEIRSNFLQKELVYYIVITTSDDDALIQKMMKRFEQKSFAPFVIEGLKKGEKSLCLESFTNESHANDYLKLIKNYESASAELLALRK
jgi:nucleoid DNA-binding protein